MAAEESCVAADKSLSAVQTGRRQHEKSVGSLVVHLLAVVLLVVVVWRVWGSDLGALCNRQAIQHLHNVPVTRRDRYLSPEVVVVQSSLVYAAENDDRKQENLISEQEFQEASKRRREPEEDDGNGNTMHEAPPKASSSMFGSLVGSKPTSSVPPQVWHALNDYLCLHDCGDSFTIFDVIVVGGGVSGLYAAWRLKKDDQSLKILVLEAEERTGGRLFSVPMPGMPNIAADMGGMHYLSKPDTIMNAWLVEKHFKMATRHFAQNSSDPHASMFLRNTRIPADKMSDTDIISKIYHFSPAERKEFTNNFQVFFRALEKTILHFNDKGFDPWSARAIDGRKLQDLTVDDLLSLANYTDEMKSFLSDSLGYKGDNTADVSCLTMLSILTGFVFGVEADFNVPVGGMEDLPRRLRSEFESMGGSVITGQQVIALSNCTGSSSSIYHLLTSSSGKPPSVHCALRVILAVPQPALESLWWRALHSDDGKRWQTTRGSPAFKLYLGFDRPWWRSKPFGFYEGTEVSTLEICHTLYIGTQADHSTSNSSTQNKNSLLLATYANSYGTDHWRNMDANIEGWTPFLGHPNKFVSNTSAGFIPNITNFVVSKEMVDLAMKQLAIAHGVGQAAIPPPYTAVAQYWPQAIYGWHVGVNVTEAIGELGKLDKFNDVYISNSGYSKAQGWVEGALRSTEYILETYFNLKPLNDMPVDWLKHYATKTQIN